MFHITFIVENREDLDILVKFIYSLKGNFIVREKNFTIIGIFKHIPFDMIQFLLEYMEINVGYLGKNIYGWINSSEKVIRKIDWTDDMTLDDNELILSDTLQKHIKKYSINLEEYQKSLCME